MGGGEDSFSLPKPPTPLDWRDNVHTLLPPITAILLGVGFLLHLFLLHGPAGG